MLETYYGEFAALLTAAFWTITALAFEVATRRVGTYSVNIVRLLFGLAFLSVLTTFTRGLPFPTDASLEAWIWLSLSGIIGFVIGDLFLFASYPIISSRIAMLIMTTVPPVTALLGWIMLDEKMTQMQLLGMLLVVGGISISIWTRPAGQNKMKLNYSAKGLLFAFLGALGQAGGLIFSKKGMQDYDAFAATEIRIIAGIVGFALLLTILKKWGNFSKAFKDRKALRGITIGSFFGPFLGVSFSLIAVQHAVAGAASTLMAIVPVLIIAPSYFILKQPVTKREIIGATISVGGVILFFV